MKNNDYIQIDTVKLIIEGSDEHFNEVICMFQRTNDSEDSFLIQLTNLTLYQNGNLVDPYQYLLNIGYIQRIYYDKNELPSFIKNNSYIFQVGKYLFTVSIDEMSNYNFQIDLDIGSD